MNNQKKYFHILMTFGFLLALLLVGCGKTEKPAYVPPSEPILKLAEENAGHDFSIVLNDMDVTEDENNIIYRHKYVTLQPTEDSLVVDSTDWVKVGAKLFQENEKNLGMELISYHNGELSTTPKPVGFDWAVGNEKYGEWVVDSTLTTANGEPEKTWRYHRSPARMMFYYWMFSRRTPMSSYNRYSRSYRGKAPFYGSGATTYGTNSAYQKKARSSFYSRRASSKSWKSHTKRISRRSSRYRGGSSSRRRSGGFGK